MIEMGFKRLDAFPIHNSIQHFELPLNEIELVLSRKLIHDFEMVKQILNVVLVEDVVVPS